MGSKHDSDYIYNNKNIGPGSYNLKSTFSKIAPKMGTSERDPLYSTN